MNGDSVAYVAAVTAGIVAIITALVGGIVGIITAFRTGHKIDQTAVAVEAVSHETNSQSRKLERIEVLVDGRYGEVLQELADVKKLLADATGRPADMQRADSAQKRSDDQSSRVNLSNAAAKANDDNEA
jgi:hypothetical protein